MDVIILQDIQREDGGLLLNKIPNGLAHRCCKAPDDPVLACSEYLHPALHMMLTLAQQGHTDPGYFVRQRGWLLRKHRGDKQLIINP